MLWQEYRLAGLLLVAGVALALAAEAWTLRRHGRPGYDWRESAASLGVAVGQRLATGLAALAVMPLYNAVYAHRLATLPALSIWGSPLLFLGVEFLYYWEHRLSHRIRWLWASHAVHHSPVHFNLSAAYRLGWTGAVSGLPLFLMPLMAAGFTPVAVLVMTGLNLLYQLWLHTELVPPLGRFDRIFNSPSNHRVHHGSNAEYIDKNFGGTLMLFDHVFGTYKAQDADTLVHYGLAQPFSSYSPIRIAFHEWVRLVRDLRQVHRTAEGWRVLFGPPP